MPNESETKYMNKKLKLSLKASGVAMAVAQAFMPPAAAQEADPSVVTVTGLRASARSSMAIKKDAMEVVDSITAEDIGKLPDPNVAETLTRISGVQGYRYGGEGASPSGAGSGIAIRGLANQTASHLNGRAYFTAGSREFNIESAIPGMISGVDVYKNPSAEHIEGAIGGLVNIRTRSPSDFKTFTASLNANMRYNDLEKKTDPELFGLIGNRFDLGGGSRIGVVAAVAYQKSAGRSDNTPASRGPDYRRMVRGDSAEYAEKAALNTGNNPGLPMSAYVGRNDVTYLANVPTLAQSATVGANMPNTAGLSADQIGNIISTPTVSPNVFQESILRERKGLNLAADYRVDNTLRFYVDTNYTYYLYHQNYRFLFINQGANVRDLKTAPFTITEDLANRNYNGGSNDVLTTQRAVSGTVMNSTINPWGGDEHRPYTTWATATGVEWNPTPALSLKGDLSYIKADQKQDNRRVEMTSASGLSWDVTRQAEVEPHRVSFSGPSLSDPNNFVFQWYTPSTYQTWKDDGIALALDGAYSLDSGWLSRLKFGTRYATLNSLYRVYNGWGSRPLTSDGKPLAADQSNAIRVGSMPGVVQLAHDYMGGDAGFSGPYVVYSPDALLGNQVRDRFPLAGFPVGDYPENPAAHRSIEEKTLAGYLVGEFAALDERLKGSAGVRVVRTEMDATARVTDQTGALVDNVKSTSYTNVLPTLNATYDLAKDFMLRFGYGRGMTRPQTGDLNPFINVKADGTGSVGNADLKPQVADSLDLSLERYFSPTNYAAVAVFDKEIKGFFNDVAECRTIPTAPAFAGSSNSCTNGQYLVSRKVNGEKGHARGVEVSGQWFFDREISWLKNFGVSGSYTYVDTSNPVNAGTLTAQRFITTTLPFVSKNSSTVSAMYEDKAFSARLVYTWRSSQQLGGVNAGTPFGASYTKAYGLVDGSANYTVNEHMTVSFNASNIMNVAPNRYVGEALTRETGLQNQAFVNGRTFSLGLRYKF
jgi:iron complex outermembrane receptor protein